MCGPSRTVSERFLIQVFSGPQMGAGVRLGLGERYSPYPGSTCSEQISQEVQVQDAYASITAAPCTTERLVHFWRSERRVFPDPDISSPQKVSEIRFPGDLLRALRAPFRPVSEPEGVCAVHRGLATYLNDWLLLAQLEQEARAHTRILIPIYLI